MTAVVVYGKKKSWNIIACSILKRNNVLLFILISEGSKIWKTYPFTLFIGITLQYSSKSHSLENGHIQFVIQVIGSGASQELYSCCATSEVETV